ncbi:propanediol utilization microcompartment protein PduB [Lonepinella koalarum]|uniref:propanediol utilization microcompartment protein PduB n=1 Tax=Lonepinella koalarum TaxID=53417 RepID=UPI003F6DAF86
MTNHLVEKIVSEVINRQSSKDNCSSSCVEGCGLTEFVGTGIGQTIGLVVANVDNQLHELLEVDKKYRSIGILGARTGAGPHIFAADEAVKATNSEILKIELARDTNGGGGHGCLILFGAEDVSDARRAVEVALAELERTFGDVYGTPAGHLEFQYTARASYALNKAFGAPIGKSFGITVGCPAAIGVLMADIAAKSAIVDAISYSSPAKGTSFSNEVIFTFSGDSGAVRQAVQAAREVGMQLLSTLDPAEVKSTTVPYI